MKVKHINSGKVFDLSKPNYGKHWMSIYGYLTASNSNVSFIYSIDNEMQMEDLTEDFIIDFKYICSACSGSGYYCGNKCGACNGTGLDCT